MRVEQVHVFNRNYLMFIYATALTKSRSRIFVDLTAKTECTKNEKNCCSRDNPCFIGFHVSVV